LSICNLDIHKAKHELILGKSIMLQQCFTHFYNTCVIDDMSIATQATRAHSAMQTS